MSIVAVSRMFSRSCQSYSIIRPYLGLLTVTWWRQFWRSIQYLKNSKRRNLNDFMLGGLKIPTKRFSHNPLMQNAGGNKSSYKLNKPETVSF